MKITKLEVQAVADLKAGYILGHADVAILNELARIALASLEAEPAIHRWRRVTVEPYGPYPWHYGNFIGFSKPVEGIEDEYFYSTPPAAVSVPDKATLQSMRAMFCQLDDSECAMTADVWNACRAAMLQGAENAESPTTMQTSPALDSSPKIAESPSGNSPVIPDCWCRTCRPVKLNDMRFVVCPDCGNKRCPHANDHQNACTGSNEPGHEGSAYPAAPKQEVAQALAKGMERYGDAMNELAKREVKP